jgi:hypothetical protein
MQACGLLALSAEPEEPATARVRQQKGTLHVLRR